MGKGIAQWPIRLRGRLVRCQLCATKPQRKEKIAAKIAAFQATAGAAPAAAAADEEDEE